MMPGTMVDMSEKTKKVESYRWVVWTILAIVYVFVTFHRMAAGVVRADLESTFSIGAAQFAIMGSMYFYAYFFMQIPSGILADKIGPKKTVTAFSLLAAVGSILFGFAPNITVAYVGRFLVGIGVSVVFICLIKIQSRWFYSRNFATMVGCSGVAANLGAVLAQTPLVFAVGQFGWRNTFIYMGVAMVFFAIINYIFVKDDPKEMGLPGMDELENRPAPAAGGIKVIPALKSVISNPHTWVISINYIGLYTGYIVFLGTFGFSFLGMAYGLSRVEAANAIVAAVMGSMVGGLVIGYLSDRLKTRKIPLMVLSIATLVGWVILIFTRMPVPLLTPFLFVFGLAMTCFILCWTVGNEVNDRRYAGISTGVVNCIGYFGAACIPIIMGYVLDAYKAVPAVGYEKAFLVLIALNVVSVIATFFIKETHAQNIYKG